MSFKGREQQLRAFRHQSYRPLLILKLLQTFVVGPLFQGVKMLPPGPHFVAYSAVGKQREVSPPIWVFVSLKASQVLCRRWNSSTELLLPFNDQDEVR